MYCVPDPPPWLVQCTLYTVLHPSPPGRPTRTHVLHPRGLATLHTSSSPTSRQQSNTMLRALVTIAVGLATSLVAVQARLTCPSYDDLATPEARLLHPKKYEGFWYEVASHNVILTRGCQCSRYNFTMLTNTTFSDVFSCRKGSPTAKPTVLANHGSLDPNEPGKMVESLGPLSPPYWVLNIWSDADGNYSYAFVYACVPILGEYIYLFSRNPTIPQTQMEEMTKFAESRNISLSSVTEVPMDGCKW